MHVMLQLTECNQISRELKELVFTSKNIFYGSSLTRSIDTWPPGQSYSHLHFAPEKCRSISVS